MTHTGWLKLEITCLLDTSHGETLAVASVLCSVGVWSENTVCRERGQRLGGDLSMSLVCFNLSKTFSAGYLEQVNSTGWHFCVTHWQRWAGYCHRNTTQTEAETSLLHSPSAHRGFFSLCLVQIGKRPLCFSLVVCLVEGSEDGGCFCFCFLGCRTARTEKYLVKMVLLFKSYFWGRVALTYFDTRPH